MGSWTCWLTGACTTHYGKIIGNLIIIAVCCTQRTKTFLFGVLIYIRTNRLYSLFYFSRTFFLSSLFASTLVDSESRSAYYANIERHAHRTCKYFRFQLEFVFTFPLSCSSGVCGRREFGCLFIGRIKKRIDCHPNRNGDWKCIVPILQPRFFFLQFRVKRSTLSQPLLAAFSFLPPVDSTQIP